MGCRAPCVDIFPVAEPRQRAIRHSRKAGTLQHAVTLPDHGAMRTVSRLVLAAAMLSAFAPGEAGEASPQPQRPLLQPPVEDIPSPITDRFSVRAMYYRPSISTKVRYDDEQAATAGTLIS